MVQIKVFSYTILYEASAAMNFQSLTSILLLVILSIQFELTHSYCTPKNRYCWPSDKVWQRRLGKRLDGKLHKFDPSVLQQCENITSSTGAW